MSNSIWKTPDQKPTSGKCVCIYDGFEYYVDTANPDCWDGMFVEQWCDFYDLIAQADKAERLQKAVDLAIETLKFYADGRHYKDEELDLSVYEWYEKEEMGVLILDDGGRIENGKKARDTIEQLIKENQ